MITSAVRVDTQYRLEWLKWIAFASMVCDHVAVFLIGPEYGALRLIGLVAFPVFCLTFGVGLNATDNAQRVATRLLIPGLIAQVVWSYMGVWHVNVLLVFALCALALAYQRQGYGLGFALLVALASPLLEGGPFGIAFVLGGFYAARGRWWLAFVVGSVYALIAPSPLIVLATVLLTLGPQPSIALPRIRGLLRWGYPAHLLVLVMLQTLLPFMQANL